MGGTSTDAGDEPGRRSLGPWQETALLLALALVMAVVVKAVLVQAFYIPSASMEPGLVKDDRILVQKVSYWGSGSPERGDVVVFEDPGGWLPRTRETGGPLVSLLTRVGLYPEGGHLVKRVVGVAGDTIVCCDEEGRISVNGQPLDEDAYIEPQQECNGPMTRTCDWSAGPVPEGHLFVMGDNRDDSGDSTVHLCPEGETGCEPGEEYVDTDLVVGRLLALVWPPGRFDLAARADAFDSVPDPS